MAIGSILGIARTAMSAHQTAMQVASHNIANAETVGFKRDLALFQERRTEAREHGYAPGRTNPLMEALGGGVGRSHADAPEIDGSVQVAGKAKVGEFATVRVTGATEYDLEAVAE